MWYQRVMMLAGNCGESKRRKHAMPWNLLKLKYALESLKLQAFWEVRTTSNTIDYWSLVERHDAMNRLQFFSWRLHVAEVQKGNLLVARNQQVKQIRLISTGLSMSRISVICSFQGSSWLGRSTASCDKGWEIQTQTTVLGHVISRKWASLWERLLASYVV